MSDNIETVTITKAEYDRLLAVKPLDTLRSDGVDNCRVAALMPDMQVTRIVDEFSYTPYPLFHAGRRPLAGRSHLYLQMGEGIGIAAIGHNSELQFSTGWLVTNLSAPHDNRLHLPIRENVPIWWCFPGSVEVLSALEIAVDSPVPFMEQTMRVTQQTIVEGNAQQLVASPLSDRKIVRIQNAGGEQVWIGHDQNVSDLTGDPLAARIPGQTPAATPELPIADTVAIYAYVRPGTTADLRILEIT